MTPPTAAPSLPSTTRPATSASPAERAPSTASSSAPALPWHAQPASAIFTTLQSSPDGLSSAEAQRRLTVHGPNLLPRARGDSALDLLWRQINSPLVWVLLASAVVAMVVDPTDGLKNGAVILAVVILNTIIGFVQEFKAGKAIEALAQMVPENVSALRDGAKVSLPAADLVPGDVVTLASGDKVPADLRLFAVRSLQVEEAALTGESVPTEKRTDPVAAAAPLGDRAGMAFGGTLVTYGTASAVVVETAARTELGKISQMLKETTDLQTPLTKALASIGKSITIAIVVISLAMLAIGTWRTMAETGVPFLPALRETAIFAIALAVGAIPEGLPAIVTIALAIGVQRMAARRAVIRKLPAVETLGSTTVICSDKTGTLTRNEMTVQALWTPADHTFDVSGVGYQPTGAITPHNPAASTASSSGSPASGGHNAGATGVPPVSGALPDSITHLLLAGTLCNDSTLVFKDDRFTIAGDPTEGALVVAAEKAGISTDTARAAHPRLDAIPFESENQFMATLHQDHQRGRVAILKGAPEVILKRSVVSATQSAAVLAQIERLAAQGMRVLAFARKPLPAGQNTLDMPDVAGDLEFLGLQGMIDPPRPEAIAAIQKCHAAGITVKMITGDHKLTAQAIGAQLNILPKDPAAARAITGAQLAEMSDAQLQSAALASNVFARVAPEHKLKLVRALQSAGNVVAMTGDGVNDAPALKQANIGVAMGITGTSVSKEAAAIILTDDNFASIAAAVEEGRRVYDNLIKSLAFVLPTNLGLALILMAAVAFFPFGEVTKIVDGVATTVRELLLPMLPTQLLWINLVATVALALPLAFEAKERNVMQRPPRRPDAPVLSGFVIARTFIAAALMCAGAVGLFYYEYFRELPLVGTPGHESLTKDLVLAEAQTMAVTTVIMFQIFYMLNCRSLAGSILSVGLFSNRTVFIGVGTLLLLQALFIYLAPLNRVFGSAPLSFTDVGLATLAGMIILPVISFEKWWRNRRARTFA